LSKIEELRSGGQPGLRKGSFFESQSDEPNTHHVVHQNSTSSHHTSRSKPTPQKRYIILVPSAITSMITLYNAKEFFEDSVWISPVEKKESGAKKEKSIVISHSLRDGDPPTYFTILDTTVQLSHKDWLDVVAVFALGNTWQFKGWHWNTPVDLFSNVSGFYLTFDDEIIPDTIKSWNVYVISVNRRKRHLDKIAANTFWDHIKLSLLRK
jgi:parafibromin